jgi:hypothetical protein
MAGGAKHGGQVNEGNHGRIHDHAFAGAILVTDAAVIQREAEAIDGAIAIPVIETRADALKRVVDELDKSPESSTATDQVRLAEKRQLASLSCCRSSAAPSSTTRPAWLTPGSTAQGARRVGFSIMHGLPNVHLHRSNIQLASISRNRRRAFRKLPEAVIKPDAFSLH